MKYSLSLLAIFLLAGCAKPYYYNKTHCTTPTIAPQQCVSKPQKKVVTLKPSLTCPQMPLSKMVQCQPILKDKLLISVTGQGVAPANTTSPAQAYALAKRAAIADAYRLIAEKVKGVKIDGQDLIQNMMVKRSTVRTAVQAMIRNANIVETNYKEGLCEVSMEIALSRSQLKL